MRNAIFITATGTDVGKTYVTALIVKKLREYGLNAGYYKAALSGGNLDSGRLIPGDAKYVCDVAGIPADPIDLVSYVYQTAVSPHLASRMEGNPVELDVVKEDFFYMQDCFEMLCVEGSGGIICPLRLDDVQKIMLIDVIRALNLDILIVALAGLGTINSTVLTVEYARAKGIGVRGIILNRYEDENMMHHDNKEQIERLTGIPVIACVRTGESNIDIDLEILKCFGGNES